MKEQLLKILKVILIIFGILFLIQVFIIIGIAIGINNLINFNFDIQPVKQERKYLKQIKPIIKYVENVREETGKYPTTLENSDLKLKQNTSIEYNTEENGNCYIIKFQNKKGDSKKQYKRCSVKSKNLNSTTESYSEINN